MAIQVSLHLARDSPPATVGTWITRPSSDTERRAAFLPPLSRPHRAAATPTDGLSDDGAMWDGYSPLDTTERSWGRIQPERTQPARLMRGSRSAFTTVDKCPRPTTCTHTVEPTRRDQRAFGGNVTKAAWGIWYGRHHRVAPPRRTTASHQRLPSPPPIATSHRHLPSPPPIATARQHHDQKQQTNQRTNVLRAERRRWEAMWHMGTQLGSASRFHARHSLLD